MNNPLEVIEKIKSSLEDVIIEDKIKYLGENTSDILCVYSADFCGIMSKFFPGATIMMNKNFRKCAVLINGIVYDSYGVANRGNYYIAQQEEIGFIQKTFPQLSDEIMGKLLEKVFGDEKDLSLAFLLRKNRDCLT